MREKLINIELFANHIAVWQNDDAKANLTDIINAINIEDSASLEKLWLSASNEVRDAFIRNKTRLAADFNFNVDELPLMGMVLLDTRSAASNDVTQELRYMRSFASRCDSRHFSVFKAPNCAMENVFPTLDIQIKIEQSDSIDWKCFDDLGLNVSNTKVLRNFVIKLYHCAIANPRAGYSNSHQLFTENTDDQIKLIRSCVAKQAFTLSCLSKTPTQPKTVHRFNLIEIAILYNNLGVADKLANKSVARPIQLSSSILLKIMFPRKNKDIFAALNWIGEHTDSASLNSTLALDRHSCFRKAIRHYNLALMDWIWDHIGDDERQSFFRHKFKYIHHEPFVLIAKDGTLELMKNLWKKAEATNTPFTPNCGTPSIISTAGYYRKIDMITWLWSRISIDAQQKVSSECCKDFFIALSKFNFAYMKWIWNTLNIDQQQQLIASVLEKSDQGKSNCEDLYIAIVQLSSNGNFEEVKWLCEIITPELRDKFLTRDCCGIMHVALSNNRQVILEHLMQQSSDFVRGYIRMVGDGIPELLNYLNHFEEAHSVQRGSLPHRT